MLRNYFKTAWRSLSVTKLFRSKHPRLATGMASPCSSHRWQQSGSRDKILTLNGFIADEDILNIFQYPC